MLRVLRYSEIDRAEWSRLVETSSTGTWFQAPEAYDFFASMPELFRPFVIGVASNQSSVVSASLRGVCCGYVTVEKSAVKQFFTRRAIIMGGPVLADDCTDEEVFALLHAVRQRFQISDFRFKISRGPIYIETRNFNDYSKWRSAFEAAGFAYQPHLNFHVDCSDKDMIWERLSENRKRQIKKVSATESLNDAALLPNEPLALNEEKDILEWYEILRELYRTKVKTPLWPAEFFLTAYRAGIAKFLFVKNNGKVVGGSMLVKDEKSTYEWFECGLNATYKEQYPSVMATWVGMTLAHEAGCERYDMMGAGTPGVPYGVRDFKSEFGGQLVEHGRFVCVIKPWLYKIGTLGVRLLKCRRR